MSPELLNLSNTKQILKLVTGVMTQVNGLIENRSVRPSILVDILEVIETISGK